MSERGSEVVQFAMVAPLLIFLVFAIIQVGGMMLAASQVSSDIVRACRQLDVAGLHHATNKEAFVKAGILGASTQLRPDSLQVDQVNSNDEQVQRAGAYGWGGTIEQRTAVTRLSYNVTYVVPSVLDVPGLADQTFKRRVDCRYVTGRVIEVELRGAS